MFNNAPMIIPTDMRVIYSAILLIVFLGADVQAMFPPGMSQHVEGNNGNAGGPLPLEPVGSANDAYPGNMAMSYIRNQNADRSEASFNSSSSNASTMDDSGIPSKPEKADDGAQSVTKEDDRLLDEGVHLKHIKEGKDKVLKSAVSSCLPSKTATSTASIKSSASITANASSAKQREEEAKRLLAEAQERAQKIKKSDADKAAEPVKQKKVEDQEQQKRHDDEQLKRHDDEQQKREAEQKRQQQEMERRKTASQLEELKKQEEERRRQLEEERQEHLRMLSDMNKMKSALTMHHQRLADEDAEFHKHREMEEQRLAKESSKIAQIREELIAEAKRIREMRESEESRRHAEEEHAKQVKAMRERERLHRIAVEKQRRKKMAIEMKRKAHLLKEKQRDEEIRRLRQELHRRELMEQRVNKPPMLPLIVSTNPLPSASDLNNATTTATSTNQANNTTSSSEESVPQMLRDLLHELRDKKQQQSSSNVKLHKLDGPHGSDGSVIALSRTRNAAGSSNASQLDSATRSETINAAESASDDATGSRHRLFAATIQQPMRIAANADGTVCFPATSPIVTLYLQGVPQAPLMGSRQRESAANGLATVCYRVTDLRNAGIVV